MIEYHVVEVNDVEVSLDGLSLGRLVRDDQRSTFEFKPLKAFRGVALKLGPELVKKIMTRVKTLPRMILTCPWCAHDIIRVGIVNAKLVQSCGRCGWWMYDFKIGGVGSQEFIRDLDHARMTRSVRIPSKIKKSYHNHDYRKMGNDCLDSEISPLRS